MRRSQSHGAMTLNDNQEYGRREKEKKDPKLASHLIKHDLQARVAQDRKRLSRLVRGGHITLIVHKIPRIIPISYKLYKPGWQ